MTILYHAVDRFSLQNLSRQLVRKIPIQVYKSLIVIICLVGTFKTVDAQQFKNVIGPSPEAAAFAKYGEIPVNNYTGIPNIQIPLYTVVNKDILLPITLSYHAGGFRVDEEAGRAGLGWTLNAGGVISRSVNGNDDFQPTKGYLNNTFTEYFNAAVANTLRYSTDNFLHNQNDPSQTSVYSMTVMGNQTVMNSYLPSGDLESSSFDLEPDVYNYNFNGISGKFSMKKNLEIVKQDPDGFNIKLLNSDGSSWQITTTDGTRYIFDKTERVRYQGTNGLFTDCIISWYLTEIISAKGDEINLTYTSDQAYSVLNYNNLNEKYIFNVLYVDPGADMFPGKPNPGTKITSYPSVKSYNLTLLNSITFPKGSVSFTYENRIDLIGDKRLSKISVNNNANPAASFTYDFVQDYFTATNTSGTIPDPAPNLDQNIFNKRLKLNTLLKKNSSQQVDQKYQFVYNELELPSKKSFSRDHWGFYNGAANTTFLPNTKYASATIAGQTVFYANGANRDASATHVKASILKEIIYPTGGKTTFDFESNDFDVYNSESTTPVSAEPVLTTETKTYLTRRGEPDASFNLTLPTIMTGSKIIFNINSTNGQAPTFPYPVSTDAFFEIYSAQNLTTPVKRILLGLTEFWTTDSTNPYSCHRDDQFELPAGNYVIKTHFASNVSFLNYIQFSLQYNYYKDNSLNHSIEIGGGVRVSKITSYDPSSGKSNITNFGYRYNYDYNSDGIAEECSYGRRMAPLDYVTWETLTLCGTNANGSLGGGTYNTFNLYSQSNIPNSQAIVGYDKVSSWKGVDKTAGYTEYTYKNLPEVPQPYFLEAGKDARPAGIPNTLNLDNGLLTNQTNYIYDPVSLNFRKISEKINVYEQVGITAHYALRMLATKASNCSLPLGDGVYFLQYPSFQSSWNRLTTQTMKNYTNATNFISTTTSYEYEAGTPKHYQPIITTATRSNQTNICTVNLYPTDYASSTAFIDDMKLANILKPIETVTYIKDGTAISITGGNISTYKSGGKGLVDKQYVLETNAKIPLANFKFSNLATAVEPSLNQGSVFSMDMKYKPRISLEYDNLQSNLLNVTPTDGTTISYLWGYDGQYPIAEVKNAPAKDVLYEGFEDSTGTGISLTSGHSGNNSKTNGYSRSLTGLTSGQYTLSYWRETAGVWSPVILDNIDVSGSYTITISSSYHVDDIRFYPQNAAMTTYTYQPLVGMTSQTDAKGVTTNYEYDSSQRLKTVKDQNGKIIKSFDYHYKGQ